MTNEYSRLLIEAYNGERMGIVLGRELAARSPDPQERAVFSAFEHVERVARAQLDPLVAAIDAEVDTDAAVERQGIAFADAMIAQPRAVAWAAALPEFERFIGLLERLRELAPADHRAGCDVLVAHEVASVAMAQAIIDDDLPGAQVALDEFLATV